MLLQSATAAYQEAYELDVRSFPRVQEADAVWCAPWLRDPLACQMCPCSAVHALPCVAAGSYYGTHRGVATARSWHPCMKRSLSTSTASNRSVCL